MKSTVAFAAPGHMAIQSPAQRASVGAAYVPTRLGISHGLKGHSNAARRNRR